MTDPAQPAEGPATDDAAGSPRPAPGGAADGRSATAPAEGADDIVPGGDGAPDAG